MKNWEKGLVTLVCAESASILPYVRSCGSHVLLTMALQNTSDYRLILGGESGIAQV